MNARMRATLAHCLVASALLLGLFCSSCSAKEDAKAIYESVSEYGPCLSQATFSFLYPSSLPPRNEAELKSLCKSQAEGIKCLKEKTRGALPILRRGIVAFANTRSKHHRKICTNTASEQSRRLVEATKCLMEKRFAAYYANDAELAQTQFAIARKNYNDSAAELKQICCAFYFFKRNYTELAAPDCSQHRAQIEEIASEVVSKDTEILCDDEEKLSKSCAKLERIQFKREPNYKPDARVFASSLAMYLISTLGEPNEDPNLKI